jgi:hypothetical protein
MIVVLLNLITLYSINEEIYHEIFRKLIQNKNLVIIVE